MSLLQEYFINIKPPESLEALFHFALGYIIFVISKTIVNL